MLEEAAHREQRDMRLLRRYRQGGDLVARDQFVTRFAPLVRTFAAKYTGRGEERDDLFQVGMVGLMKAMEGFDIDSGHRFVAYAAPTISGEIKRHFRDRCWTVSVPRSMKELQARVTAEQTTMIREGRAATPAALATRLGIAEQDINQALQAAGCFRIGSLSFPSGQDREVLDTMGRTDRGYQDVENADLLADAMTALSDRDRSVVRMRYQDEMLQREIGTRVEVSQMQVSRILDQAATTMRRHLDGSAADAA